MKEETKTKLIMLFIVAVFIIIIMIHNSYITQENSSLVESQEFNSQDSFTTSNTEMENETELTKITDLSDEEISEIKDKIIKESSLFFESCDEDIEGECIDNYTGRYYFQTKIKEGKPARTKQVISGYRTLCRDGEYSPSNAKGRGACSHHGGVADWNAPVYSTEYIEAIPAQYEKEKIEIETTQVYKAKYNSITDSEVIDYYNLYE